MVTKVTSRQLVVKCMFEEQFQKSCPQVLLQKIMHSINLLAKVERKLRLQGFMSLHLGGLETSEIK